MSRKSQLKNDAKADTYSEKDADYSQSMQATNERNLGLVPYTIIFSSASQVKVVFPKITGGEILNFLGNQFYWKRSLGELLILYGKKDKEIAKDTGLVEICRMRIFETWAGIGSFRIDWPQLEKKDGRPALLITLFLYSVNAGDMEKLVRSASKPLPFLVSLFLDSENAELFNQLAEEKFDNLR